MYLGNGVVAHQTYGGYMIDELPKRVQLVRLRRAEDEEIPDIVERALERYVENPAYRYLGDTCEDGATAVVFGEGFSPSRERITDILAGGAACAAGGSFIGALVDTEDPRRGMRRGGLIGGLVGLLGTWALTS